MAKPWWRVLYKYSLRIGTQPDSCGLLGARRWPLVCGSRPADHADFVILVSRLDFVFGHQEWMIVIISQVVPVTTSHTDVFFVAKALTCFHGKPSVADCDRSQPESAWQVWCSCWWFWRPRVRHCLHRALLSCVVMYTCPPFLCFFPALS
jgi:hypothetical protein